jgi:hypothetical protein
LTCPYPETAVFFDGRPVRRAGSSLSKGAKGKGKAKRAHSEDGSGHNRQRKSKEKKRDTDITTKEIKCLEKLLNKLKAKKGDEMDSDDLD